MSELPSAIDMQESKQDKLNESNKSQNLDWEKINSILEKQLFFRINDLHGQKEKLEEAFSTYCNDANNKGECFPIPYGYI